MIVEHIKQLLFKESQTSEIFDAIKSFFGVLEHTVTEFRKIGFILPDGSWIDLSDDHEVRTLSHRMVANAILNINDNLNLDDILNMGVIRCDGNLAFIDVYKPPTYQQLQSLKEFLKLLTSKRLEVSYYGEHKTIEFPKNNVDQIINLIQHQKSYSATRDFLSRESLDFENDKDKIIEMIINSAKEHNNVVQPSKSVIEELRWISPNGDWITGHKHIQLIEDIDDDDNPFKDILSEEEIKNRVISMGFIRVEYTGLINSMVSPPIKALNSLEEFLLTVRTKTFEVEKIHNGRTISKDLNKTSDDILKYLNQKF